MRRIVVHLTMAVVMGMLILLAFALSPIAHAEELTPQEKKLIAAAKQEGAVTIINPLFSDRTARRMGEASRRPVPPG